MYDRFSPGSGTAQVLWLKESAKVREQINRRHPQVENRYESALAGEPGKDRFTNPANVERGGIGMV